MSQDDATVMEKRKRVSEILNARSNHLKREIARLQSSRRLSPHSALVASVRAGEEEAGERLMREVRLPGPFPHTVESSLGGVRKIYKTKASYADRIEDARKEIQEIEGHLTDLAEGDLDPVLDDLLYEADIARDPRSSPRR